MIRHVTFGYLICMMSSCLVIIIIIMIIIMVPINSARMVSYSISVDTIIVSVIIFAIFDVQC